MTERWYFGKDPVSSVFAGDVRLYPTTPPQQQIEFPIIIDEKIYQEDDLHVFASNGKDVKWPSKTTPIFVAVNGYEASDYDNPTVEPGDRIYALFDWDNSYQQPQDWYYDILQIGSVASSELTQPRQLANGAYAFTEMTANPKVLVDLDISNITTLEGMFAFSKFDVDISGWDTEHITNMDEMFFMSTEFNHDLGNWKVENVELLVRPNLSGALGEDITMESPVGFDAGAFNWRSRRPPFTEREANKEWFTGFPITIDGVTYTEEDAHMMVTKEFGGAVNSHNALFHWIPITDAKLVVHNGVIKDATSDDGIPIDIGASVLNTWIFIGDWGKVSSNLGTQCIFLKIGSRSVGDEPENYVNPPALPSGRIPNQLKSGEEAFKHLQFDLMEENTLSDLDTSNLTNMDGMFEYAPYFNEDISGWDTSNVKSMASMFDATAWTNPNGDIAADKPEFTQDISGWDTSKVTDMSNMFKHQTKFNQDISSWNTSKVRDMGEMFYYAESFNQDLSEWCVSQFAEMPQNFDSNATSWTKPRPQWGTCPRLEIIPEGYSIEDFHIFVANGNEVSLPIPSGTLPIFVAVNGVDVTPTTLTTRTIEVEEIGVDGIVTITSQEVQTAAISANDGDTIHAIFDWDNADRVKQDWYSDILQFGLNSGTGKRNQLHSGFAAFLRMSANPDIISNLDVSNLSVMGSMFNTARNFNQDLSGWDVSNAENINSMFQYATDFNSDISGWNISRATSTYSMFNHAESFNMDISNWDTSSLEKMDSMFSDASSFNQDLSEWCVSKIGSKPTSFDANSGFAGQTARQPQWGTCPRGENIPNIDDILPEGYVTKDCHIFVANGNEAEDGLPCQGLPTFVAVNGVDVTPTTLTTRTIERKKIGVDGVTTTTEEVQTTAIDFNDGDIIHAIFDWHNTQWGYNDWYSDIFQIGSRSEGGEPEGYVNPTPLASGRIPNQLKSAFYAFYAMTYANSAAIANLDISNLTRMESMFCGAEAFNQDISHWDTSKVTTMEWMFCYTNFDQDISDWDVSKVTDMDSMFYGAFKFNQDLSQWCVSQFDSMPYYFDNSADSWTEPRPVWGSCPRFENIELPDGYEIEDCHIFIANGNEVKFPCDGLPTFVAVNGEDVTPTTLTTRTIEREEIGVDGVATTTSQEVEVASITANDGDTIHAIFDWVNNYIANQDWFSDILQFGYNSETGKRNQLKSGLGSFGGMEANPAAISTLDVSNLTSMNLMFYQSNFNQPIGNWDTSNVTYMQQTFYGASSFNQDISKWDTSNATMMNGMFYGATSFNQDLSQWCVSQFDEMPEDFDSSATDWTKPKPVWGTCPRFENIELPDDYELADAHIFIASGNEVNLPIPNDSAAVFVAVDGVAKDYTTEVKGKIFNDSTIHAIFDWDNANNVDQNWFSDILQFGLNSETGYRNQLKDGFCAFTFVEVENVAAISNLDISNLTNMEGMFEGFVGNPGISNWDVSHVQSMNYMFYKATSFNEDISGWDTSNVTIMDGVFNSATSFNQDISKWDTSNAKSMGYMFSEASSFNQDLSQWCVSNIGSEPRAFDWKSGFEGQTARHPQWGTCPRFEDTIPDILPERYEFKDCHIFVANENKVNFAILNDTTPTFVAVDGVKKDYVTEVKGKVFNGSIIHAIFGWNNYNQLHQDWFSDILQFGLNFATDKRNQLNAGIYAFYEMEANPVAISTLDVSNLRTTAAMFQDASLFNQDISKWNISNVIEMSGMFSNATSFNQDISGWDTSRVIGLEDEFGMAAMFDSATSFNQDLSQWCVSHFIRKPVGFDLGTRTTWTKPKPVWGTCPSRENVKDYTWPITIGDKTYEKEDAHIFVSNGNEINFPTALNNIPIFVGVNGQTRDPIIVTRTVEVPEIRADGVRTTTSQEIQVASIAEIEDGDIIEAIFDWDNYDRSQNWFSDILQFGLNSLTGKRNQLRNGRSAFYKMEANPAVISTLDVSNLIDMQNMFYKTPSFNQNISGWDTSNVTNMTLMFDTATSFKSDISGWDVSNVTNMAAMFGGATSFNQDISEWDTSNVTDMMVMFEDATSFNQDLSQWCVSNVEEYEDFDNNSGFAGQTARQPQWGTCPRGEDIIPDFDDDILPEGYEIEDCHILVANGLPAAFPVISNDPRNCPIVFAAVNGVEVTPTYHLGFWTIFPKPNQIIHAIFDWNNDTSKAYQDWFSDILQFGLNSATGQRNQLHSGFSAFYEMEANPVAISTLNTSNLTNMEEMFHYAENFNQDISGWDTSKVTSMRDMFNNASWFESDISEWDTSNVTNMRGVFHDAAMFDSDISKWDTSNVMNMSYMFARATSFNQDISEWDTSNVTDMKDMFSRTDRFNLSISEWDTSKVTNMTYMFNFASSFDQDISKWCVSLIKTKPSAFDSGSAFERQFEKQPQWGTCPNGEGRT